MWNYIYLGVIIVGFIVIATQVYAAQKAAPWAPTRKKDVNRFLKLARIKKGDKVYDLGCGDGRLVAAAARAGADAVGFEISLFPYFLARLRLCGLKNGCVKYNDFWKADLSDADVVYFFLMPKIYAKMKKKLQKDMKKGAKVIAYVWAFDEWKPEKIDEMEGFPKIYVYKI